MEVLSSSENANDQITSNSRDEERISHAKDGREIEAVQQEGAQDGVN